MNDWPEEHTFRGTGVDRMTRVYEMQNRYGAEIDAAIDARELKKLEVKNDKEQSDVPRVP